MDWMLQTEAKCVVPCDTWCQPTPRILNTFGGFVIAVRHMLADIQLSFLVLLPPVKAQTKSVQLNLKQDSTQIVRIALQLQPINDISEVKFK